MGKWGEYKRMKEKKVTSVDVWNQLKIEFYYYVSVWQGLRECIRQKSSLQNVENPENGHIILIFFPWNYILIIASILFYGFFLHGCDNSFQ